LPDGCVHIFQPLCVHTLALKILQSTSVIIII
jgi:hypothetical protein